MASYHCNVSVGKKGRAAAHASYISRDGKYSDGTSKTGVSLEDLEATGSGNMPRWAAENPQIFWMASDEFERANGTAYRSIEVALPRELTPEQRRELVDDFIKQELGDKHAYQYAIHCPRAALEGGEQPHAHIMYSERVSDGHDRAPDKYFARANSKNPEKGGCRKDSAGTKERLAETRQRWSDVQNAYLERHGHADRVDYRSYADRGIAVVPERHLGPEKARDIGFKARTRYERVERAQDVSVLAQAAQINASARLAELAAERVAAELRKTALEAAAAREKEKEQLAAKRAELAAKLIDKPTPAPPAPEKPMSAQQWIADTAAARATVAGYAEMRQAATGKEYKLAAEGQRIVGKVLNVREMDGRTHAIVDVGRDRVLMAPAPGMKGAAIGKQLDGVVRNGTLEYKLQELERGKGRGIER